MSLGTCTYWIRTLEGQAHSSERKAPSQFTGYKLHLTTICICSSCGNVVEGTLLLVPPWLLRLIGFWRFLSFRYHCLIRSSGTPSCGVNVALTPPSVRRECELETRGLPAVTIPSCPISGFVGWAPLAFTSNQKASQ